MTLTIIDLALIGATTGFTSALGFITAMVYMKVRDEKRKRVVMEEMLGQMHDKIKTQEEFEEIVQRFRTHRGEE